MSIELPLSPVVGSGLNMPQARALIGDPRLAKVMGYDTQYPAIAPEQLTISRVRQALTQAHLVEPATIGDGNLFKGKPIRSASVLIGLVDRPYGLQVLLTQRASHLRDHAGQIAFPGGASDTQDQSAWHTAMREAWEEIGLEGKHLDPLGALPIYSTVSAFEVTPCVASISAQARLIANQNEVSEVFEVPLVHLMNPNHHEKRQITTPVGERTFYAIPYLDADGQERFIWGATAGMLRNLYRVLAFALK